MNRIEIMNQLPQFIGTEKYYRLYPDFVITDGAKFIADECGAYWLMTAIWSHITNHKDNFISVNLVKDNDSCVLTLDDGNGNIFAEQEIEYSDFPLDKIRLYVVESEMGWCVMLPSEY